MPDAVPAEPLKFAYWVPNVSGGLVTRPPVAQARSDSRNSRSS
ncbi:hypothetical protein ACH347_38250 [Saccharopolyspora sp. 5N102]